MRVLIVDDTPESLKVLRVTLEAERIVVFEAADGLEAMAVLDRQRVDAVISDILMPRMDGYRLCYELRRRNSSADIPFIFYSNTCTSPGDERLALDLGGSRFLRKPAAASVILEALREAVAEGPSTRTLRATLPETDLMRQYNERLVAKLEDRNVELAARTEALMAAQQELHLQATTLESAANAIVITDRTGAIQWANPAFTTLTGYTADEIRGRTPRILKSGHHNAAFYRDLWGTILAGKTWRGEFTNRRKDGTLFHDEHTITPVRSVAGEITHFVGILHDVTARKQAEEAVVHRAHLANLSAEVSMALTRGGALPEVLRRCAVALAACLDAAFARIWTLDEAAQVLELRASAGMYTHLDGPHSRVPVGRFKIGLIAQEKKPHLTNQVLGDPRVNDQEWARREGMIAFAGYPLQVEGRVVGVMALFARHTLCDVTLTALASVADGIALGIEHKRAEEELRATHTQLSHLMEHSPAINYALRIQGRETIPYIASENITRLLGFDVKEAIRPDWWYNQLHPEDHTRAVASIQETLAQGVSRTEYRLRHKNGGYHWFEDSRRLVRDPAGQPEEFVGVLVDITQRMQADLRLGAHHEVTRLLAEAQPIPQTIKKVLEVVCRRLDWDFGSFWTLDTAAGTLSCRELWHPPSTEFHELAEFCRNHRLPMDGGLLARACRTGQAVWVENIESDPGLVRRDMALRAGLRTAFAFPLQVGNKVLGVLDFFSTSQRRPDQDVLAIFTALGSQIGQSIERRQVEDQFRQSQKMEAFGQLAGGVAHDFNNILAVMMGFTQLILEDDRLAPDLKEQLKQIYSGGERAANLTRQLLTFSRKKEMQTGTVDLNEVVGNLTKMLGRIIGEDIRLQCNFASSLPALQADEGMIEQVLMNLAVNARDAMPRGGSLVISTSTLLLDEAAARANPEARAGHFVCLSVLDSGCGMSPEVKARIFEPFFTTKDVGKGTGLGLATVFGIVKQHQGWIEVDSQVGAGSTFRILFPASPTSEAPGAAAAGDDAVRGGDETILVVEDEAALRGLTRLVLQRHGYTVLEAGSGPEAIELWEEHGGRIDLLLTDMVMPEGLTGRDLAKKLQALKPGLKVIYTSGYTADTSGTTFRVRESSTFIQKPYQPKKLARLIRETLDQPAAS